MSRRAAGRASTSLAVVAAALCGATPALARQTTSAGPSERAVEAPRRTLPGTSATAAELTARIDSLRPLLEAARLDAARRATRDEEARREAAAAIARVDTIRVGLVRVITPVDQVELARELFAEVWNEQFTSIQESPTLDRAYFAFQWSDRIVPIHIEDDPRSVQLPASASRSRVAGAIHTAIASTINFDLRGSGAEVARWVQGDPLRATGLDEVYRIIATSQSRSARGCMAGEIDACRLGLALGTSNDLEHIRAWYTPDERRALVARYGRYVTGRFEGARWGECVDGRAIEVCDGLLDEFRRDWAPLGPDVRETVLAYAMELGGAGAWSRLLEDPAMDPISALEHVSGSSLHDLLDGWRARVVEHRPPTFANLAPRSGLTLLWILFFAALATRSTRWRFG